MYVVLLTISLFILIGLLIPAGSPSHITTKQGRARYQIQMFSVALDTFDAENGFYPSGTNSLNNLTMKPAGTTNWHQYIVGVSNQDPWGHPYLYDFPGLHNTNSYDLSSAGPDGIPGTSDDIVNWQ